MSTVRLIPLGIATLAAALSVVAGCSAGPAAPTTSPGPASSAPAAPANVLRVDIATPPASLDPAAVCSLEDLGLLHSLYPQLTQYKLQDSASPDAQVEDPTQVEGNLAESWTVSEDGLTYTFTLRTAAFPSGAPIDAEAVKWSFDRALALGSCGSQMWTGGTTTNVGEVEVVDAQTVAFHLTKVSPNFLFGLTSAGASVIDRTVLEQQGATPEEQNQWLAGHFAGGGAYVVADYQAGQKLTLTANPGYWGAAPLRQTVEISFVPDDQTLLLRAQNAQADVSLGLTKQSVASLKENSAVKIIDHPAATWQIVSLPNEVAPFDNVKLREALTYAVPQQQLVEQVAHGYAQTYYGLFPPAFPAYNEAQSQSRGFDLDKAKQLVAESGVTIPISLDLYIRDGVNDQAQIATILQDTWKQVGVELKVNKLSAAAYQEAVSADKKEWALLRFDGPAVTTPGWILSYDTHCGSLYNQSDYCNPKVDELEAQADQTADDAERQKIWDEVNALWIADSPRAVVFAQNYTAVLQSPVTAYVYGQNDLLFNLWG